MQDLIKDEEKLKNESLATEIAERLGWLGSYGKDPDGGVSRLLYSKEWGEAQQALKRWMETDGLEVQFDEIGNLSGILKGIDTGETILTGSHIDTVTNGGLYDGQYGIVAGIIAIIHLKKHFGQPKRNLEIMSLAEEEGSRFPYAYWGSKNVVGTASRRDVETIEDFNGVPFVEAMTESGFSFRDESKASRQDLKAFVEIHVEQGNVLEIEKKSVGVVHSIVGQRRFTIEVTGEANHAGTTPMGYRKDAVFAASQMIYELISTAKKLGDPLVLTVGKMEVKPNIVNVVPGKVIFTIDMRHTDKEAIVQFTDILTKNIKDTAKAHGVEATIDMWMDANPVQMNEKIVGMIEEQCKKNNLNYKLMHSGAGHDAQIFAEKVPTAMLFVPSRDGISHNPAEYTEPADLAEGVKALISTLYELAYK